MLVASSADYMQLRMNWQVKSKRGLVLYAGWKARLQSAKFSYIYTHMAGERIKEGFMLQGESRPEQPQGALPTETSQFYDPRNSLASPDPTENSSEAFPNCSKKKATNPGGGVLFTYSFNKHLRHLYQMLGHSKVLQKKDGAHDNQEKIT